VTETEGATTPLSPDLPGFEPVGFPPPWPTRPWIYANVITSRNGIVTWSRAGTHDDPVRAIAGGNFSRPGRCADVRLMRRLRAGADAVSFGAQTLRDQPDLLGALDDVHWELGEALIRLRAEQGRGRVPLQVVYSESGRLDLGVPIFNTPGVTAIVVTSAQGARLLHSNGSDERGVAVLVAGDGRIESSGLVHAHERLFDKFGVRYVDCEGGAVILEALHQAGILDEIFVTVTDVHVDPTAHEGVKRVTPLEAGTARLIAEHQAGSDPGDRFQRYRIRPRTPR
jgi:riboflavin biosynthesis pyrimidine reductase